MNVYSSNANNLCSISALTNNAIYYQVHYVVFLFDVNGLLELKLDRRAI